MHHAFKLGDEEHSVALSRAAAGYRLHVGEQVIPVDLGTAVDGHSWLRVGGETVEVVIATRGDDVFVHLDGAAYELRYAHALDRLAAQLHGNTGDHVRAPMPGSLVAIHVKAGDNVARGQALLVMESMKMETTIAAPRDGVIDAVHFAVAQSFERDALLLSLSPNPSPAGGKGVKS